MTISYQEAREIARRRTEPGWSLGTYCLDDRRIVENDEYYVFRIGAREFLVDDDYRYAIMGGVPVVHKDDGHFEWIPSIQVGYDDTLDSRENPDPTLTER